MTNDITMETVRGAAEAIRAASGFHPELGIVLGTGLGALADEIDVEKAISYEEIPGLSPYAPSRAIPARLLFGTLEGQPVVAMQGRFHLYEGHDVRGRHAARSG